jgi:hypothetical protein
MGDEMGGMPPELPAGGPEAPTPPPQEGMPFQSPADLPPIQTEGMSKENYDDYIETMIFGKKNGYQQKKKTQKVLTENESKNDDLNKSAENMISEIDTLLESSESINKEYVDDMENVDIEKLDDIDLADDIQAEEEK